MNNDTSDLLTLKASNTQKQLAFHLLIFYGNLIETKDSKTNDLFVMLLYSLKLNPKLILNLNKSFGNVNITLQSSLQSVSHNIVKTWGYFQKMFPGNLPAVNSSTSSISKSQTLVRGEHINQIII